MGNTCISINNQKWKTKPVACMAVAVGSDGKEIDLQKYTEALFLANDEYFSVQGRTGLYARHATAKALLGHWRYCLGRKHPMNLELMIRYLIQAVNKGSTGAKVTDFANHKGTLADPSS